MSTQQTRWEWRAFGSGCAEAEQRVRSYPLETSPRRATHILCDMSGADARLADGELVLRVLRQSAGGLEHWATVLHVALPIDDITVRRLFGYLDLRPPVTQRQSYTLHQFLEDIVAPHHALTTVQVGQRRHATTIGGCTVDIAELMINGMPSKTLGIEGEDPSAVNAVLAELGLTGRPTVNFVEALKQQLASTG